MLSFKGFSNMYILFEFLKELYVALCGCENNLNSNIVRIHTRKLDTFGDLSFPQSVKNWIQYVDNEKYTNADSIFDCFCSKDSLIERSKTWSLIISSITFDSNDSNVILNLNRNKTFKVALNSTLSLKSKYGARCVWSNKNVHIAPFKGPTDFKEMSLSLLKLYFLQIVAERTLQFAKFDNASTNINKTVDNVTVEISLNQDKNKNIVLCGPVLNEKGSKNISTTADKLFSKRSIDMRLMAEHKYGLRVTTGWNPFFEKLGEAAVIIHLLQNKPQHTTTVKIDEPIAASNKGAPFILYNCARLYTLFKEFDKKVNNAVYPPLPLFTELEFDLLQEPEEWELLFVYILQFPSVIRDCVKDIEKGWFNPHYLISHLSGMSRVFSVYYRRVRILMDPRQHLFPIIHQRIYLLKALEQVMHNGLYLLHIDPVKHM